MDIVERLRDTTGMHEVLIYEAADEIERLRDALHKIAHDDEGDYDLLVYIARSALNEDK